VAAVAGDLLICERTQFGNQWLHGVILLLSLTCL
jgi:hypothetical protein